jgi:hypothetical protein
VVINKEMQTTEVVLTMPDTANFVPGFEKFFVSVTGDMLGSTMKNLEIKLFSKSIDDKISGD